MSPMFPPVPERIQRLPVDPGRRLPVPWFVDWIDGRPEFRFLRPERYAEAINRGLCWICGGPMGRNRAFVIGPMCAINRVSADPPSHRDCAVYSTAACPFLANPRSVRRETGMPDTAHGVLKNPAGIMIRRNPGVALVWITKRYQVEKHGDEVLFRLGDPEEALWFAEGRAATRGEVMDSVESGYPLLLAEAEAESPAAVRALKTMFEAAKRWLPAER